MNDLKKRSRNDICIELGKNILYAAVVVGILLFLVGEYFNYGDGIITAPNLITRIELVIATIITVVIAPRVLGWFVKNKGKYSHKYAVIFFYEDYWAEGATLIGIITLIAGVIYILITSLQGNLGPFFLMEESRKYLWAERVLWGSGFIFILAVGFFATLQLMAKAMPRYESMNRKIGCTLLRLK